MKVATWQGEWRTHKLEVQLLPRLMLGEVRLLVDGEERDRSLLFRTLKLHRLCALAVPEGRLGLIEVTVQDGQLAVAVDGEALTEAPLAEDEQPAQLALQNGLFCGFGFFAMAALFMLLFNVIAQGFPPRVLPSPMPPLVLAVVMGLYYFIDTRKRLDFRATLKGR
ncbi:hypothetical protein PVT67_11395 [Gallaecimonas kandeliae]|uniref:hypothetical protein n=1 Tax=Gallaecimonas kandeliae TaxID=3029055 RepID=UPI00264855BB|nr:hypothetical protein [Gallaecimonas kandeliae]WKE64285.1 hypothetical protein PVT67_11395 [Gallaecimonas kandeliae]